ncbi:MAG: hypothetical protein L0387_06280 [Acidobacteria bacterium]|nr:hypothetical protein [Acidobacteriota bacterium]MCI0721506.1 hypothetical protein [Acidobacteriota bacterium]
MDYVKEVLWLTQLCASLAGVMTLFVNGARITASGFSIDGGSNVNVVVASSSLGPSESFRLSIH